MIAVLLSYVGDLFFGDPEWFPHPVRGIGTLIRFFEDRLAEKKSRHQAPLDTDRRQARLTGQARLNGIFLFFAVTGITVAATYFFLILFKKINPFLGNIAIIYIGFACLSIKDMRVKAKAILSKLSAGAISEARNALSKIVGRDTERLDKEKIIVATVESIAESTTDGIVAPLFYLILGGPVFAMFYKAVSTLDSMVGYKNEKYADFGWFSARFDDLMNFIPARITGLLIAGSSLVLGKNFKDSFSVMIKDGRKHPSPNSGIPEAAMAGALGIKLGGASLYEGRFYEKPDIGKNKNPVTISLINETLAISFTSSVFMIILGAIFKWLI